jgi:hypothetical protein
LLRAASRPIRRAIGRRPMTTRKRRSKTLSEPMCWITPTSSASNPRTSTHRTNYNDKKLANDNAIEAFGAFRWMDLGQCDWERYTLDDIPEGAKARITTDPKAAYHCSFKLHYQINPPYGDPKTVATEGFFFKYEGNYTYAGKFDTPY